MVSSYVFHQTFLEERIQESISGVLIVQHANRDRLKLLEPEGSRYLQVEYQGNHQIVF